MMQNKKAGLPHNATFYVAREQSDAYQSQI